jgi:hypothetical protein
LKLIQLREKVRNRAGVASGDQFITPQVIDDAINQALFQIDAEYHWPWLEETATVNLVVGQASYALPADHRTTRTVMYQAPNQRAVALYEVAPATVYTTSSSAQGAPEGYALNGDQLVLVPAPAVAGTLLHLYYRTTLELVNDLDAPLIPDQYHPAVVAAAAGQLAMREEMRGIKEACDADVAMWVRRMRGALRRSTGPVVPRVRPGGWI